MEQPGWGLVLAGGGGKGAYQIGVWKALRELGLEQEITAVSGASVGALNGVLFGLGDLELAEKIWDSIDPLTFLDVELTDGGDGIFNRDGLLRLMEEHIDFDQVSACGRELYVNACHMEGRKATAEYFLLNGKTKEQIQSILLASSALPVIYDSVKIGEKSYRDGGLKDNLPIKPLYERGYRKIIVAGLSSQVSVNALEYPGAAFLPVLPSRELGDFLDGVLDFTREGAFRRMRQGYEDGREVLFWYLSEQEQTWEDFQAAYRAGAEETYRQIRQEEKQWKLEEEVNQEIAKLKELMKKYDAGQK